MSGVHGIIFDERFKVCFEKRTGEGRGAGALSGKFARKWTCAGLGIAAPEKKKGSKKK